MTVETVTPGYVGKSVKEILMEKPRPLINALPCPLCKTNQVQVCLDANNPQKDFAKCRHCHCQAPLSIWNKPR